MNIPSYWKSANIGDPKLVGFFNGARMVVEEKLDGSQFSFAKLNGQLLARSKGKQLDLDAPEKLFSKAVEHVKTLDLPEAVIFRGEAITSNKHNTLCYQRTPPGYVVIFNAMDALTGELLPHHHLADLLGFMSAPQFMELDGIDPIEAVLEKLNSLLECESALGGPKVEGVVVKRTEHPIYYMDRPLFAKLVSPEFREKHKFAWKESNPKQGDVLLSIIESLATDTRFMKSVQHLQEDGRLTNELQDIGPLIKEVNKDVLEEEEEWIKEQLWKWAKQHIARGVGSRVPGWYKEHLVKEFVAADGAGDE